MNIQMNSKLGIFTGYAVSGTTGMAGVLTTTSISSKAESMLPLDPHMYHHHIFGLEYSEVAVIVGIIGTISTMLLQFLSYRRLSTQPIKSNDTPETRTFKSVEENKP